MAQPKLTKIPDILGLNNVTAPENMEPGELADAQNINIHSEYTVRRQGFNRQITTSIDAAWSDGELAVYQSSGELYRVLNTGGVLSSTLLYSGLSLSSNIEADEVNGRTYLSNKYENLVIENGVARTWGLVTPLNHPSIDQIAGLLPGGLYFAYTTFVRDDGQESGVDVGEVISLDDNSGIRFTNLPVSSDPSVVAVNLYLSTANGEVFYLAGQVDNGVTTFDYLNDGTELRLPLKTLFMGPPPAGDFVEYFRGRMYVAVDNVLYQSEPYNYELFDLRKYHMFSSDISLLGAVDNGIYLATEEETYYLTVAGPVDLKREKLTDYGAIRGTMAKTDASRLGDGKDSGEALIWWSVEGMCVGLDNGAFSNLTQTKYKPPSNSFVGTGVVRSIENEFFYLAAISQV